MSENTELTAAPETQPPAEEKTDAMRVQLLEAKNLELKGEKQKVQDQLKDMQRQMADLQKNHQKAKQAELMEREDYKTLYKDQSGTVSSLQAEVERLNQALQEKDVAFQQQQIKAAALNAFSQSGVHAPDHMFTLLKEQLRLDGDGNVVCLVGGVQTDLSRHLESLRSPGSGMDYFFSGSGARGMSAAGSTTSVSGGKSWGSMGLMEQIQMQEENPQLAAQLKAQG